MATTFCPNFKKSKNKSFMKENLGFTGFRSSKYSDKNRNPLSRIQITTAAALNSKDTLPDYILFVIDNELPEYLEFSGCGIAAIFGSWLEWLCNQIKDLILEKHSQLPIKAQSMPQVYWVHPPNSDHFEHDLKVVRVKFVKCLEYVIQTHEIMHIIKLKSWESADSTLVPSCRFTAAGMEKYWIAIDNVFRFNDEKRKEFKIHVAFRKLQEKSTMTRSANVGRSEVKWHPKDPMYKLFDTIHQMDRFHWNCNSLKKFLPEP